MLPTVRSASQWLEAFEQLDIEPKGTVLVVGTDAGAVADSLQQVHTSPIVFDRGDLALASADPRPSGLDGAVPSALGMPDDSVDVLVLRHAWSGRADLVAVVAEGYRVCRPGGVLAAFELDVDRLAGSPVARYPARLQFELRPELLARVRHNTVSDADLSTELVRAGFRRVRNLSIDESFGTYPVAEYLERARRGGWHSMTLLSEEARDQLIAEAAAVIPSLVGEVVYQRQPWLAVSGIKPG